MWVRETFLHAEDDALPDDKRAGVWIGEGEWYECWQDDTATLFRSCLKEYGRCLSRMYRDRPGAAPVVVGWVFGRRERYEDAPTRCRYGCCNFPANPRPSWRRYCPADGHLYRAADIIYPREVWVEVSVAEPVCHPTSWSGAVSPWDADKLAELEVDA